MSIVHTIAEAINVQSLPNPAADNQAIAMVLQVVFGLAGSIALLMIVIGGFRYILAHGDPSSVSQAKKTVLYAVIGLLVCMASYSIVIFVVKGVV